MVGKLRTFIVNIFVRIVLSFLLSASFSLGVILLTRLESESSLDYVIQNHFLNLTTFFFPMFFLLLFGIYLISFLNKIPEPKRIHILEEKLRSAKRESRLFVAEVLKNLSVCLFFIVLALVSLMLYESVTDTVSASSYLVSWFLINYFLLVLFIIFARFLMNHRDWTLYHLRCFRKSRAYEDLEKALRDYNKILGSSLSMKQLLTVSQYVHEAYKVLNREDIQELDNKIDNVIASLENKEISKANEGLIDLSKFSIEHLKEHEQILGFKVKYPYRLRLWEHAKMSIGKIFPQFILFLIWIALWIVLLLLGKITISPPP